MPEFVLRIEGEYSICFEAEDLETAMVLAQVSDEWEDSLQVSIEARSDSKSV